MGKFSSCIAVLSVCLSFSTYSQSRDFVIYDKQGSATIVYDTADYPTVKIASQLLAEDIERVTGHKPVVSHDLEVVKGNVIIIGSGDRSRFTKHPAINKTIDIPRIAGKWETYLLRTVNRPLPNVSNALVICGSDKRGTAYGVFDLSQRIGVSPWYWWADVTPKRVDKLSIPSINIVSNPPTVKYRGIFLNDEDWGLQPWAAKTFEPETGDIGPKTYAKIFELLLRLRANLIWPAMHESTRAFYHYPKSREVADLYGIVIGSSHAEPMLRNNVDEWNPNTMGEYNYFTNRETVYKYWGERVEQSKRYENIYTVGMRGVHDSGMEGASNIDEKINMLQKIFSDQRTILSTHTTNVAKIPQAFIPYKEVLELYDAGLQVPEDITLVWPDDNYGYITRLNDYGERKRSGGSGVYYHISYWGRPHDYLWLDSTHPMLVWEEMSKAYQTKCDRIWVVNVGDIKPSEYKTQLFLDMAYDMTAFSYQENVKHHLQTWMTGIFGKGAGPQLTEISWEYYQLAFERRPEFMGWNQIEPVRSTRFSEYNHFYYNDEAQKRLDRYSNLHSQLITLPAKIAANRKDAFYELVYYPVRCAQLMNRKFLQNEKAYKYAAQHRLSANDFASLAKTAYDSIVMETEYYNNVIRDGKWKRMISMHPRDLPVFESPMIPVWRPVKRGIGVCVEGYIDETPKRNQYGNRLPTFYKWNNKRHFIDVFLLGDDSQKWEAVPSDPWVRVSKASGVLSSEFGMKELRIWVSVDHSQVPKGKINGSIAIKSGDQEFAIPVNVSQESPQGNHSFIEENKFVSIPATEFTRSSADNNFKWQIASGLGHTGTAMMLVPTDKFSTTSKDSIHASLEYDFFCFSKGQIQIGVHCLPTHSLNLDYKMRIAISVDCQAEKIIDFATIGRSEQWKQNVLRNSAVIRTTDQLQSPGMHTIKISAMDPGIVIDQLTIDFGGLQDGYSATPATKVER